MGEDHEVAEELQTRILEMNCVTLVLKDDEPIKIPIQGKMLYVAVKKNMHIERLVTNFNGREFVQNAQLAVVPGDTLALELNDLLID